MTLVPLFGQPFVRLGFVAGGDRRDPQKSRTGRTRPACW